MRKTFIWTIIYIILTGYSCNKINKTYSLHPVDSFSIDFKAEQDDNWSRIIFFNKNRMLSVNDTVYLSYISQKDSAIELCAILPYSKIIRKISLRKTFSDIIIDNFPSSFYLNKDTAILFYASIHKVLLLDKYGNILHSEVVKPLNNDDSYATGHFSQLEVRNSNIYLNVTTTDSNYISYIYPYCDQVYTMDNDTLRLKFYSGQYPANFMKEYIHMNYYLRAFLGNYVLYTFQSSDSIYKYDLSGNLLKKGVIASSNGGHFTKFDTNKHGDLPYITKYCTQTEQNQSFIYSDADSIAYLVKRLPFKNADEEKHVLICLDADLNTKFEMAIDKNFISNHILFIKDNCLYTGNFDSSKVVKYSIDEK